MTATMERTTPGVERFFNASVLDVWSVLRNGWLYPTWVVGASRMRDVDDNWPAVGAKLHHSVGNWPFLIDDRTEVLDVIPERRLRLKAHAWPAGAAEVVIELEEQGSGTRVSIQEDAVAGPAKFLPKPLRQLGMLPRNRETLKRLAFLAEGHAAS